MIKKWNVILFGFRNVEGCIQTNEEKVFLETTDYDDEFFLDWRQLWEKFDQIKLKKI